MQTLRVCVRLLRNKTKRRIVAIYHLSVKTVSRSAGRSATAAAAYRAGDEIVDERTGDVHDYTRKGGVESAQLFYPVGAPEWAADRARLWNAAELAETRKNSTVAREFEIALPSELPTDEQQQLAHDLAREIVARHGCAADVAIHAAGRGGDNRNHHAHILLTTRRLAGGGFTEKTRELDERKSGEVDYWRERFATLQNAALARNGVSLTVDHRSLEEQGIERAPTQHLGVAATGFERRTGEKSNKRLDWEQEASERLAKAKELGELSRESLSLDKTIIDLSDDLSAAKAERDRQFAPEVKQTAASGVADFRAQFEQAKQLEAGKAQVRQAFEQFKAEQEKQQVAELARQQHETDAKTKAEQQQKEKDRDHGLSM
jgi:ATP-dependent exoDNAse (exonuclease V) alpha subunit